jgi:hypothetical protein
VHSLVDTDGMRPSHRSTLAAAAAVLALPVAAHAQLGLPLPDPTQVITQTTNTITDTVTGVISDPTGTVTGTVTDPTGTVGSVIDTVTGTVNDTTGGATGGITGTVGGTIDQVLGGTLGSLPTGTIDDLLGAAGLAGKDGAAGANGAPGVTVLPDGTVVVDKRPPNTKVKVLDRNRKVGKNGKLRLQISSDEPSVVALVGSVKPGRAYTLRGSAKKHHSRKAVKIPKVLLAYRKAGALRLTIQFSRSAERNIRHSYNSTVRLSLVAVDVARNQVTRKLNRVVRH